jgi:hypothetical protein
MRRSRWLFLLFVCGLSWAAPKSGSLDFDFMDAAGRGFNSMTFSDHIRETYKGSHGASILLLKTPTVDDRLFVKQRAIVDALDAEQFEFVVVVSCLVASVIDGYHTDIETAKKLNSDQFKIIILKEKGRIVRESRKILSKADLKKSL